MFTSDQLYRKLELGGLASGITKTLARYEFCVFLVKAFFALVSLGFGIYFIYKGLGPSTTLKLEFSSFKLELNRAYPGIILSFIGLMLLLFSRLNLRITQK